MFRAAALALAITVGACAGIPVEAQIWTACKSFIDVEMALRPFKASLTARQTGVVLQAVRLTRPICTGNSGNSGNLVGALAIVQAQLAEMVRLQQETR